MKAGQTLASGTAALTKTKPTHPCKKMLSKKPPRPRFGRLGTGCTTRLQVQPNISQSGLSSRCGLDRVRQWC